MQEHARDAPEFPHFLSPEWAYLRRRNLQALAIAGRWQRGLVENSLLVLVNAPRGGGNSGIAEECYQIMVFCVMGWVRAPRAEARAAFPRQGTCDGARFSVFRYLVFARNHMLA